MSKAQFAGKYKILGMLGEGGMGIVYKAYDPMINRTVAIKTIHKNLLEGQSGQELLRRFRLEAQAAGRLTHPNIVAIYDYDEGEKEGCPYFIMEFVEGKELKDYLKMGVRFTFEQSLHIIEQVLEALGYAHQHGIIHRDIKPANVILLEDKNVKIADFGIAKLDDSENTQTGRVMGTPSYMSPEQCQGKHVDCRSDLYSAGLLLYELLTGKKATAVHHLGGFAQIMKDFSPDTPDTSDADTIHLFNTTIKKALAEDPDQRFQSAEAFLKEIKNLQQQHASHKKTNPLRIIGSVMVGAILAIGIVLFIKFYDDSKPPEPQKHSQTSSTQESPSTLTSAPTSITQHPNKLNESERKKIDRLLKVARTHRMVGRLITPMGSNAHYSYKMVLAIDSSNTAALNGIDTIEKDVIKKIKTLQKKDKLKTAKQLANIGKSMYPDNEEFQKISGEVSP